MDIKKILIRDAERYPQKPAIIFHEKPITFSELKSSSFKFANALHKVGIESGDKVSIFLPNSPEYIISYLGIFSQGAVVVPLDFSFKYDELKSCLIHAEAEVLVTLKRPDIDLSLLAREVPTLQTIILCGEKDETHLFWDDFLKGASDAEPKNPYKQDHESAIFYTSGTTGRPKGVLLNYRHLSASPQAMEHFVDLSDKDTKICALPLSHAGGLVYLQNCIYFGITLILMDRFIPLEFLKNVSKYKVTCFHLVPSMYYAILHLKEFEKFDLSSLRWVDVFGAPNSPDVLKRFHQYCPKAVFLNGWGLTETNAPNTVTPLGSTKLESVGKPAPWIEIKIFDDDHKEVAGGLTGEIGIKSWVVMLGYYKDAEATQAVMKGGWFMTGDLGKFDEEGYLYILGRKREIIKVAGQLVYAPEVEAALHKHASVAEVAVIGVADSLRGESIRAFVVPKENEKLTEEDLKYFAKEHLAHFKVPHSIIIRVSLPKTRSGKVDKEALKQAA